MSIKSEIKKRLFRYKYFKRINSYKEKEISSIAIIFYIPKTNKSKYSNWEDGFTKAIDFLKKDFDVTWINLEDAKPTAVDLNQFDFLIVKSCWDWIVDNYVRSLKNLKVPRGIAISCSKMPYSNTSLYFYDVLWYETNWYGAQLKNHPRKFQAFGINSKKFFEQNVEKKIDILSIGLLAKYKRHHLIANEKGIEKVVVGDSNTKESKEIKTYLEENNIKVIDYTSQEELSKIINQSKLIYIPAELNGGGERAVLEARLCKAKIKIENDNPKLKELLTSKIFDEEDYYKGLLKGIKSVVKTN